jgi:hypothetical protein
VDFVICNAMTSCLMGKRAFRRLTPQPIRTYAPCWFMFVNVRYIRTLALLLAVIFLGAQFHYCADLNSPPSGSHVCPLCSAVGSAVTPGTLDIVVAAAASRSEVPDVIARVSLEIPHSVSPRAPPAV